MLEGEGLTNDLNASTAERLRAGFAGLVLLTLLAPLLSLSLAWLPLAAFAGAVAINWRLFSFFRRRRGVGFALLALLYHQLYYLYSAGAFVWCLIESKVAGPGRAETA